MAMNILIAGAGDVGIHLAKLLSREDMTITLMDKDGSRMANLSTNYDILTQIGSPISLNDLKNAGVKNCDLFVGVTPFDSVNLTACIMAHNLGAKRTLARIDNYEYLLPEQRTFFKNLGLDHLIYPEVLAAQEITDSLKTNWLLNQVTLCEGALELLTVKVRENASIINKPFKEGSFNHGKYRVVAIKRGSHTIIPGGDDQIEAGDLVYFITTPAEVERVRKDAGKVNKPIKEITFMGASKIAQKTIQNIQESSQYTPSIKVMDAEIMQKTEFINKLNNALLLNIDMRNTDAIHEEGIDHTDALIAVSESSEANILACLSAQRNGVLKTIAEVENNDYIPLAESLDIAAVINKKFIAASYIYQLTLNASVLNVRNLTSADAQLVEFNVKEGSRITQRAIKDLFLPENVNIGGLVRNGIGMTVNGMTQIMPDDHVIVFCMSSAIRTLEKFFK